MIRILVEDRTIPVEEVPFVIGREADCDLVLDDPRVSRHHAQVEVLDDGRVVLRDLGSANGTFVGEDRIDGGAWFGVPGEFRVGRTTVRIERDPRSDETMPAGAAGAPDGPATMVDAAGPGGGAGPAAPAMPPAPPPVASPVMAGASPAVAGAFDSRAATATPAGPGPSGAAAPAPVRSARIALGAAGIVTLLSEGIGLLLLSNLQDELGDAAGPLLALTGLSLAFGAAQLAVAWLLGVPRRDRWTLGMGLAVAGTAVTAIVMLLAIVNGASPGLGIIRLLANAFAIRYLREARDWYRA